MSQRSWSLSQEANKSSGVCCVCRATRQLHHKDGLVHRHGPRDNPCPGSHKPPLSLVHNINSALQAQSPASGSQHNFIGPNTSVASVSAASQHTVVWSPADVPIIKHIPKSARPACAAHLAKLLRQVTARPSIVDNWLAVLNWSQSILVTPKRGGKRHNLVSLIRKRIDSFLGLPTSIDSSSSSRSTSVHSIKTDASLLAQAVSSKLEDGNLKAAIRILNSDEGPVKPSAESLQQLKEKHPPGSGGLTNLPDVNPVNVLSVSDNEVRSAVQSFPAGSSGGPDGMRPQHLKDLASCRESGTDFLSALTGFTNTVMAGLCPSDVRPFFFGGRLIALSKKTGGVRPIAVGVTLRRLVSKCANAYGAPRAVSVLGPRQLGVGIPAGCEAAIHSARRYLQSLPADHVMVKLDFANAFNSLHRSDMLLSVQSSLPELYAFCFSSYFQPSYLYFGSDIILSQEGPQQGDPLGPLLFSLTIHPLLMSLQSDLTLGYLDDLTLAGHQDTVAIDVRRVLDVGGRMGLQLNPSKCEVISHPDTAITDSFLSSFAHVSVVDAALLGAPLFPGSALDAAWADRCADLTRAVDRLSLLNAQDALLLLRVSFSSPRVQHLLRCAPSVDHPALLSFDKTLRSALSRISNTDISDTQWLQASLPIRQGGLGIRQVGSLALPAYLASAATTSKLQTEILSSASCSADQFFDSYLTAWQNTHDVPSLPVCLPEKQSFWDQPGILSVRSQVEASCTDPQSTARFLAAAAPHSGDWLLALPVSSCGLRLSDDAVRVAVALRLGCSVCVAHTCRCGSSVDTQGLHGLVCKKAPSRVTRHQAINDVIARSVTSAGIPATKEPVGLTRSDGKRPDGLTLTPWQAGKPLTWDVTVVSTLADSYVRLSSQSAGGAAEAAANRKAAKYAGLPSTHGFQPLAFESHGTTHSSASDFLNTLGGRIASLSGDHRETSFLWQRLSIVVQRFNAILISETFLSDDAPDL